MVSAEALTATRLDVWHKSDPLEGRYSLQDQAILDAEAIQALAYAGTPKSDCEETLEVTRRLDLSARFRCSFVVCFRMDDLERDKCWREYIGDEPGVMLRTTVGAIARSLKEQVFLEEVTYLDHDVDSAIEHGKPSFFLQGQAI